MKHFKYFPTIEYDGLVVTDIFRRAVLQEKLKQNITGYNDVRIPENSRPDILSDQYYGDSENEWLFFYANDMIDPIHDWPMNTNEFNSYLEQKYNSSDPSRIFQKLGLLNNVWINTSVSSTIVNYQIQKTTPIEINQTIKHPFRDEYRRIISVDLANKRFTIESAFSQPFPSSASQLESADILTDIHSYWQVFEEVGVYNEKTNSISVEKVPAVFQVDYATWLNLSESNRTKYSFYEWEILQNDIKRRRRVIDKTEANTLINDLIKIFK
jgi:hypothetical protein